MYELKSCPFCGGILETRKDNMFQIYYAVHVPENYNCPLNNDEYMWENPLMRDLTEEDLIKKLNNRPLEEELQQRIADLESLLRWRPVTKELPEEDYEDSNLIYDIVILYPNGKPSFIALGYYHDRRWYSNSDEDLDGIWGDDDSQYVTHWKPRIPAPKEVKGE